MRRTLHSLPGFSTKLFITILVLSSIMLPAFGQPNISFIKAASKKIKILDGLYMQDGELVPELNPDTYYFRPSPTAKKIVYFTDRDSIVFYAKAGDTFTFAIILNKKDTCYQRVTSENPSQVQYQSAKAGPANDTIPFELGPNNAIHLKGAINGSMPLDLIFDTGANIGVLSEEGKAKGAALRSDNKNLFEIGGIIIRNSPGTYIDYHGRLKADGVLGYNAFDGKVLEINYDKNILVVHNETVDTKGWGSTEMKWGGANMFVEGSIGTKNQKFKGYFLFDTGSKWALSLNKAFVRENNLYESMKKIGTRRAKGADGKTIKSNTVILPFLHLAGFSLPDVPADLELGAQTEGGLAFSILGNDVLKRFNVVLDYRKGLIFLKPNSLLNAPYTRTFDPETLVFITIMVALIVLAVFFLYRKVKRSNRKSRKHNTAAMQP